MLFTAKHDYNMQPTAETIYFNPIHTDNSTSVTYDVIGVAPVACTMTNLAVKVSSGMESGVTATFTFRKGASIASIADTTLGCAVTSAATFCTDTDSISLNAGDVFTLKMSYNPGSSGPDDTFITSLICN